jgi:hypothetical protein
VHETVLNSGWDTFLYAVPVIFMLVVGVFRLDELFAAPRQNARTPRPPSGIDKDGQPLLCDPDGRPFHPARTRK